jgi:hypothetical protein
VSNSSTFTTDLDANFTNISINVSDSVISLCQIEKVTNLPIETLLDNEDVQIFPNPTQNQINVICGTKNGGKITIFSNFGEEIMQFSFQSGDEISLEKLPSGVYFAKIETEATVVRKKIVKVN